LTTIDPAALNETAMLLFSASPVIVKIPCAAERLAVTAIITRRSSDSIAGATLSRRHLLFPGRNFLTDVLFNPDVAM
jgi:hypothetical protein